MWSTVTRSGGWEVGLGFPRGFRDFEWVRVNDGGVEACVRVNPSV